MRPRRINWLLIGVLVLIALAQWVSCRSDGTGKVHLSNTAKDVVNLLGVFAMPVVGVVWGFVALVRFLGRRWRRDA